VNFELMAKNLNAVTWSCNDTKIANEN